MWKTLRVARFLVMKGLYCLVPWLLAPPACWEKKARRDHLRREETRCEWCQMRRKWKTQNRKRKRAGKGGYLMERPRKKLLASQRHLQATYGKLLLCRETRDTMYSFGLQNKWAFITPLFGKFFATKLIDCRSCGPVTLRHLSCFCWS